MAKDDDRDDERRDEDRIDLSGVTDELEIFKDVGRKSEQEAAEEKRAQEELENK